MSGKPTIYVIDGAGYYFRAYFAIKQRLTNAKGTPTNAVYGYTLMLRKILKDAKPDYLVVALDSKEKTFRHEMYELYKAHRPDMPEDLAVQLPYVDKLIDGYNLSTIRIPGWEADDIIGTIAAKAGQAGYDVVIVTSDKDMMQLVRPGVSIYDSLKDKTIGEKEVLEKFGVAPEKVIDVLGLMGDSSDNIPGVPGVGEKTAISLVTEYGGMEAALDAAPSMTKKKLRDNLMEFADQALLSKKLATISLDVPLDFDPEKWRVKSQDDEKLRDLFTELDFTTMLKELSPQKSVVERRYTAVIDDESFNEMIAALKASGGFAMDTETTSIDPLQAVLVGMSFCCEEGRAYYLPLRHELMAAPQQLSPDAVLPVVKELLEDEKIPKYGHNIKYDMLVLWGEGVTVRNAAVDTMIASYLLNPSARHGLSTVAMERLSEKMIEYAEVCGSGAKQITFDKVPVDQATAYSAEDADMTYRLVKNLMPDLEREGLAPLLRNVEMPLVYVLAEMEKTGMLVDAGALAELSALLGDDMKFLEEKIHKEAGEAFNINSPKQLAELLFDKLKLPGGRKTKTGYSTDQDTLDDLAALHPIPKMVSEYRQMSKLKSTYADALPKMINPKTGRIHTSFNQTVAATGRLSSSDPNLQNIPIRTEAGRKIRQAFIAPPGSRIVSADYSQIELRLLAHYSGEKALLEAFSMGEDIHTRTAAELFGVAKEFVTVEMRRVAKTVNFGVIYGQTPFGLSRELRIPQSEAKRYIDNYFRRYPGILDYMGRVIAEARVNGFVTTLSGRRRYLPDINATNRQARQFAERNAVNTPMQGSAADLIKIAMISVARVMEKMKLESRMVLQVHDELVFEAAEGEVETLIPVVKKEMEEAGRLNVPLVVDIKHGANWDEAH